MQKIEHLTAPEDARILRITDKVLCKELQQIVFPWSYANDMSGETKRWSYFIS